MLELENEVAETRNALPKEYLVLWSGITTQISDLKNTIMELTNQIENLEDLQKVAE